MGRIPNRSEAIVDEFLRLQNKSGLWEGYLPSFASMDSAYVLVRLPRRIGYREQAFERYVNLRASQKFNFVQGILTSPPEGNEGGPIFADSDQRFFERAIRSGMTQHWALVHDDVMDELVALADILELDHIVV